MSIFDEMRTAVDHVLTTHRPRQKQKHAAVVSICVLLPTLEIIMRRITISMARTHIHSSSVYDFLLLKYLLRGFPELFTVSISVFYF